MVLSSTLATSNISPYLSGFFNRTTLQEIKCNDNNSTCIVGRSTISPRKYSFFMFLDLGEGKYCGGLFVHENIVLTAGEMEMHVTSFWEGEICPSPNHMLTHSYFNLVQLIDFSTRMSSQ